MKDLKEAGHIIRIGVIAFVLPVWLLVTGLFLWNGNYIYAGLMSFFSILMLYGVYMNWKRITSDEKIDDERMKKVNWKAGFSSFWTMINAAILTGIFQNFLVDILPISQTELVRYDVTLILAAGFVSYFAFRTYYLRFGLESDFWRLD